MIVYQVRGKYGSKLVFKTLREARAHVSESGKKNYDIRKCKMVKPSIEAMLDVINSGGGNWCEEVLGVVESVGL